MNIDTYDCSWGWLDFIFKTIPILFWVVVLVVSLFLIVICLRIGFTKGFYNNKLKWFGNWRVIYVLIFQCLTVFAAIFKFTDKSAMSKYLSCLRDFI